MTDQPPAPATPTTTATPPTCAVCHRDARYRGSPTGRGKPPSPAMFGGHAVPLCARHFVRTPTVLRRAGATALVVGTILTALNQGDLLLAGDPTPAMWWKIPLTYLVPFCVTIWGALTRPG